ncbi:MAG: helix-turn-helix domain-containing protein, partial [Nanopusillaceae archaeon]
KMICEICGINKSSRKVFLEGALINICENCFKNLKIKKDVEIIKKTNLESKKRDLSLEEEFIEDNFHEKLKKYRESKKLKQKDMAKLLGIKENLYKSIEEGKIVPSLELAKKIEKIIGEKIIKKEKIEKEKVEDRFNIRVADVIEFEE